MREAEPASPSPPLTPRAMEAQAETEQVAAEAVPGGRRAVESVQGQRQVTREEDTAMVNMGSGSVDLGLLGQVQAALRLLTPQQEQVLRLRFGIDGRVYARVEVSRQVGVPLSRVRAIESRALQRLRLASVEFPELAARAALRQGDNRPPAGRSQPPFAPEPAGAQGDRGATRPPAKQPGLEAPREPRPFDITSWDEA